MIINPNRIECIYVLVDEDVEQVTGVFLYKTNKDAIQHMEWVFSEVLREKRKALEEGDYDLIERLDQRIAKYKRCVLKKSGSICMSSGIMAGMDSEVIIRGKKWFIENSKKEDHEKYDEN